MNFENITNSLAQGTASVGTISQLEKIETEYLGKHGVLNLEFAKLNKSDKSKCGQEFNAAKLKAIQTVEKRRNELIKKTEGLSGFGLIKFIFLNNTQSSFLGMVLGVFLGIFPVIFSAFNGYILGFVAALAVNAGGGGVLWRILPHGIFELPAIFISLGLGLRMGLLIFQHSALKRFKDYLYELIRVFLLVVLPLLILAAIIEGSLITLIK